MSVLKESGQRWKLQLFLGAIVVGFLSGIKGAWFDIFLTQDISSQAPLILPGMEPSHVRALGLIVRMRPTIFYKEENPVSKIPPGLGKSLGMTISAICPFSIAKDSSENHCAHYVSHIMGYELPGSTCKNATWADKQKPPKGATIRVNDLFGAVPVTGPLANKPAALAKCLIFVTLASNMKTVGTKLSMGTHPKKHVGILSQGKVWNYSNTHKKVVADILSLFQSKFSSAYKTTGTTVEFYYGEFI